MVPSFMTSGGVNKILRAGVLYLYQNLVTNNTKQFCVID